MIHARNDYQARAMKKGQVKKVVRAKVVTEVTVHGTNEKRKVFYATVPLQFDDRGRVCRTIAGECSNLSECVSQRNVDGVHAIVWTLLNFVHNGNVPRDIRKRMAAWPATPIILFV